VLFGSRARHDMKTSLPKDIDEYIAAFPPRVQKLLEQIRDTVRKAAPDAKEAIKYQMPTFVLGENLVHFAAFQKHIGFYPTPSAIKAFSNEIAGYVWAKGSVQFPLEKGIPTPLIRGMVEFRVKEVRQRMGATRRVR
jgi:uncharacterized protein YdhG (YjbR/CyaY superfamily)